MVINLFGRSYSKQKSKADVKEQVRDCQRRLRHEVRIIERSVMKLDFELSKITRELKLCQKRNDVNSIGVLAKEVVRTRKTKERMMESIARLNSISLSLKQNLASDGMAQNMQKSSEVMKNMSTLLNVPQISQNMHQLSTEMAKIGIVDEMVGEAIGALDDADLDAEASDEVNAVLEDLALNLAQQMPNPAAAQLSASNTYTHSQTPNLVEDVVSLANGGR